MTFHYAGKYDGDESKLPQREHPQGAVPFREPEMKRLSIIANVGCICTMLLLAIPFILRLRGQSYSGSFCVQLILGGILPTLFLPVHEFLHALVFKEDVYMYNNLKQGLMFVTGTEDMSKARFIFMSLCPNIFLGFIPYGLFMICPELIFFGAFGGISIGMGFGDYINVYNAVKQMPKNAKTYLSGTHSFWYLEM